MAGLVAPRYVPELLGIKRPVRDAAPRTVVDQQPEAASAGGPDARDVNGGVHLEVEPPAATAPEDPPASARGSTNAPNVVGQTLERGSAALRRAGLGVSATPSRTARGAAAFQIISQIPSAGAPVEPGARVE